jgi:hypothetical protein
MEFSGLNSLEKIELICQKINVTIDNDKLASFYRYFLEINEDSIFWEGIAMGIIQKISENYLFPPLKWPMQDNYRQVIGGFIFFPREIEYHDDTTISLYLRPRIMILLSYSAQFGNPIALYHLWKGINFCTNLMPSSEVKSYLDRAREEGLAIQDSLSVLTKNRFNLIIENLSREISSSPPDKIPNLYLMKGLAEFYLNDKNHLATFRTGAALVIGDTRILDLLKLYLYKSIKFDKSISENDTEILSQLTNSVYLRIKIESLLLLGASLEISGDDDRLISEKVVIYSPVVRYYKQAASLGSATAYFRLASLSEDKCLQNLISESTTSLYYKSIELGMLDTCGKMSRDILRGKKYDEMISDVILLYEKAGESGDPIGYVRIGDLYKKKEYETAIKYYHRAGIAGYAGLALISREEAESKYFIEQLLDYYRQLYNTALGK